MEIVLTEWSYKEISLHALMEACALKDAQELADILSVLVDITATFGDTVRVCARRRVGELKLGALLLRVEPAMELGDLLRLFSWSAPPGLGLIPQALGGVSHRAFTLKAALAAGFILATQKILREDIHRAYLKRDEELMTLRGRPRFERLGQRPLALGVPCRYVEMSRDTLPNRLLFAGCISALEVLEGTSFEASARACLHVLQGLVHRVESASELFSTARDRVGQRRASYVPALTLAKMLLHGGGPMTVWGQGGLSGWWVDMPTLFERAVTRAILAWAQDTGLCVKSQETSSGSILDGSWEPYQSIRPDLEVWCGRKLLAIVDAKYKNYLSLNEETGKPRRKLDREDIYQLAFYGQTAPESTRLFVVSPQPSGALIPERYRQLWMGDRLLSLIGVSLASLPNDGSLSLW